MFQSHNDMVKEGWRIFDWVIIMMNITQLWVNFFKKNPKISGIGIQVWTFKKVIANIWIKKNNYI